MSSVMNNETVVLLEKHFDTAFAAPDGIKKLRELILMLAMQGKLVPQDPTDRPASELLKAIEAEKKQLVKEGKIKQSKPLPEIKPDEIPYDLPKSWEWVRLGNFGIWKSGTTPSRTNNDYYGGEIPWVKSGEVKQGKIRQVEETITHKALQSCSLALNPIGSVLVAMYGANIGEVGILEIEATTNQAVCACNTFSSIGNIFLLHLIVSLKQNFITQGAGAAQPNISREKIINTVVPLPPIEEQHRIVAEIDRLMARCDELEKLRTDRNQKRTTVHTAAIDRLLKAQDDRAFSTAWSFITQHFSELYSVKENVTELRKVILQLAVMGKLVPQDPNDEPASELLKTIEREKQRLVKEGEIKLQKPLPKISIEEIPYSLPNGWSWVRMGEILPDYQNGISKRNSIEGTDRIVIRLADIKCGEVSLDDYRSIRLTDGESKKYELTTNDILITRVNGSTDLIGNFTLIKSTDFLTYCDHFIRLRVSQDFIESVYLCEVAKSSLLRGQIISKFVTTAGQKTVNQSHISSLFFPLPPLAEQRRIVEKIDRLMEFCDRLEASIEATKIKQTDLLNAVMSQV